MEIDYNPDKWMYDSSDSDWDNMSDYWKKLDEDDVEQGNKPQSKKVEQYLELQNKWSEPDIDESEESALTEEGKKLKDSFTKEELQELIDSVNNISAKIAWTAEMKEKYGE